MLSIIISSYQPHYFSALEKNIAETIGVPYELIKIDNPGLMGICEAYNKGAEQAKNPYLLFVHEDVEFTTHHWGENLIKHLQKPDTGVVGLAGSAYVPNVPFAWWDNFEDTLMNLTQYEDRQLVKNFSLNKKTRCAVIDGVFMACTKTVLQTVKFNHRLKNFHAYDIDFSVRTAAFYQNFVVNDISLKHFSAGNPNAEWWQEILAGRKFFGQPQHQKTDKKKELRYYKLFEKRLDQFCPKEKKMLLLKYNNPLYIGYKASFKNLISLCFGL